MRRLTLELKRQGWRLGTQGRAGGEPGMRAYAVTAGRGQLVGAGTLQESGLEESLDCRPRRPGGRGGELADGGEQVGVRMWHWLRKWCGWREREPEGTQGAVPEAVPQPEVKQPAPIADDPAPRPIEQPAAVPLGPIDQSALTPPVEPGVTAGSEGGEGEGCQPKKRPERGRQARASGARGGGG